MHMTTKPTTQLEEAKALAEKSGNSFHTRVVKKLRELSWKVLVSPYYSDSFTDKPREIDIISQRDFDINSFMQGIIGNLKVTLFIECKYITGKTVFWFDKKDKVNATKLIVKETDLKNSEYNPSIREHHYFEDDSVAKLFFSEKKAGSDSDVISVAINQNLNAMVYYRSRPNLISREDGRDDNSLNKVPYPIIVVNTFDHFYKVDMGDVREELTPITEPFQLEVNYAYINKDKEARNEYFLIDVVCLDKLSEFLAMLESKDLSIISNDAREKEEARQRENRGRAIYGDSSI